MVTLQDFGLNQHANNPQYQQYLDALNTFVEEKSKEEGVTHIFVGGSFVLGALEDESDLDCYVINPSVGVLLEEDTVIDGVKVDYLTMSADVLHSSIEDGRGKRFRIFAKGFSQAKRIHGDEPADQYVSLAKEVVASDVPAVSRETLITNAHFLRNQKKETERMLKSGDTVGFHLRTAHIAQTCVFYWFDVHQVPAVAWKNISATVEDKKLLGLVEDVMTAPTNEERHTRLCVLIDHAIAMLEGTMT